MFTNYRVVDKDINFKEGDRVIVWGTVHGVPFKGQRGRIVKSVNSWGKNTLIHFDNMNGLEEVLHTGPGVGSCRYCGEVKGKRHFWVEYGNLTKVGMKYKIDVLKKLCTE